MNTLNFKVVQYPPIKVGQRPQAVVMYARLQVAG